MHTLGALNQVDGPAYGSIVGSAQVSPEELAEYRKRDKKNALINSAYNSLQRISQALDMSRNEDANPLLKSDLQNASRHAVHLSKQIRRINKSLFPTTVNQKDGKPVSTDGSAPVILDLPLADEI